MEFSVSDLYSAFDSPPGPIIDFLKWLAESSGLNPDVRVADMGAGTGRLLTPLAALGWRITAYEPAPDFHVAAAHAARQARSRIDVKLGGFEDLNETSTFDLVIAVNGPFAYLLTDAARSAALRASARALRPGGLLVIDVPNFEWILSHYREPTADQRTVGGRHVELRRTHLIDRDRHTFTTIDYYTIAGDGPTPATATQTTVFAMLPPGELIRALGEAGFEQIRDFGSFTSRTPRPSPGARLLLVGSKPPAP